MTIESGFEPFVRIITSEQINKDLNKREINATGLSQSALDMLSDDLSDDIVSQLLEVELSPGEWLCVSSSPSVFYGFHPETKEPMYCTVFRGNRYLWIPFAFVMESESSDGEMMQTQLQIASYDFSMTKEIIERKAAIPFKIYVIREEDEEVLYENLQIKLVKPVVTEDSITATLTSYNKLAEQLPFSRYYPSQFGGMI